MNEAPVTGTERKYKKILERSIFVGPADTTTGRVLMKMVKRHVSIRFISKSVNLNHAQEIYAGEQGVIITIEPENPPPLHDAFLEALDDKLTEIKEEFALMVLALRD